MTVQTPTSQTEIQPVAEQAERCTGCGSPLALDQRYCLNCGKRRGGARIEFEKYLEQDDPNGPPNPPVTPVAAAAPPPDHRPEREVTPLMAAVGLTGLAVILILGVLIGRTGQGNSAPATPVIAATGAPAAAGPSTSSTSTTVSFVADWPSGKEGFTIELATLSKDGADGTAVETAKADVVAKGATEVGALDSDEYASLPAGNYVLYSGVYDTKADAEAALDPLKANFPDAQVVKVSTTAGGGGDSAGGGFTEEAAKGNGEDVVEASTEDLKDISEATGDEYQEMQKKMPPTIETPGAPPPKDNKAPGGGSGDAVEIG